MKTLNRLVVSPVAALCGMAALSLWSGQAETAGFVPNGPAVWCKFEGDTQDYGSAKAHWVLKSVPQQAHTIYLSGKYGRPEVAAGVRPGTDDGARAYCAMPTCSLEHYAVALRFKRDPDRESRNVVTYGKSMRWFGIQAGPTGGLELVFNNNEYILPLTGVQLRAEDWNWVVCSVDVPSRMCTAYLNGKPAAPMKLPADFKIHEPPPWVTRHTPTPEQFDPTWTFTNFSNARSFSGWIDEILVYSRALNPAELAGLASRPEMLDAKQPATERPPTVDAPSANTLSPEVAARLTPADLQDHPGALSISSIGSPFSIAARMKGTLTWNATTVKVHLAEGEILRQAKGIIPERSIIGFQLYVRRENPQLPYMDYAGKAESVPIERTIDHRSKVQFENIDVEIPLPGIPAAELGKMWVGVLITDASDKVDPKTGERERGEGVCVAEASTRLNGEAVPAKQTHAK
jgi:hypothetical protein